jgi:dTDP-4-dehydrorhamnose reductase
MRIVVLGATGMLGTDVVAAAAREHEVVGLSEQETDILDVAALEHAVEAHRPQAVVNCAAYTDVDGAEANEDTAMAVNAVGALNVAEAAAEVGATVVYPSTDYVFDGSKREPYVESDPVSPRSAYGRSKLEGEVATATVPRHLIVRTAWLFGTHGRNFVEAMFGAADRGLLKVVDDQVGCPTYTRHLAAAILRMLEADTTGIVHAAGAGQCSWYEFAREIFERAGIEVELSPCTTAEYPRPAPRPAYSVLRSERPDAPRLPAWKRGLEAYLAERVTA